MFSHPVLKLNCPTEEMDSPLSPRTGRDQSSMFVGVKSEAGVVELSSQQLFSGLGIQRMLI